MSNFLDNIKLIASELANMSPKTQLEIVKLCKNLCLNVKDYLVELDETTLANILSRLDDLEDELTTAEGNIQANANAIETINDTIDLINIALNNRYTKEEIDLLLTSKINAEIIELTGVSGTLTLTQLTNIINNQNIMIKRDNVLYYKVFENDTIIQFERVNFIRNWVNGVITTIREEIRITKSSGDWIYNAVTDIRTYDTDKVDELIAGAGGGLDLLWTNPNPTEVFDPQSITINDLSNYKMLYITVVDYISASPKSYFNSNVDLLQSNDFIININNLFMGYRNLDIDLANNRISFKDSYYRVWSSTSNFINNNRYIVPIRIYGIK